MQWRTNVPRWSLRGSPRSAAGLAVLALAGSLLVGGFEPRTAHAVPGSTDLSAGAVMPRGSEAGSPLWQLDASGTPPVGAVPSGKVERDLILDEYFVHLPLHTDHPLQVVVALHGFGGEGLSFSKALIDHTDRQDWVLVAPTFVYGHWHDPAEVTEEETSRFIPGLHRFLDDLPGRIGLEIKPHAVFYGFS